MKQKIEQICNDLSKLLQEKNAAYGSSFLESSKFLEILFPNGIPKEKYKDVLLLARMFDKMMRIANQKDAFNEDPFMDLAGYAILGCLDDNNKEDGNNCEFREHPNRSEYYQNGKLHRLDGPAIEYFDGSEEYYQNGELHRLDGPAVEWSDGTKKWCQNGELHRLDGPAIIYSDGTKCWYINGQHLSEEKFLRRSEIQRENA